MAIKKMLVLGGAGFIGSHIVDELINRGHEVHVIDNLSGGKKENVNPKAILHVKDITDMEAIQDIFKDIHAVFHLAALPRVQFSIDFPKESHDANVNGTLNVLIASQQAGVKKFVYSASSSSYGDQETMPFVEDMPASPKSPYGLHKYIGELYCKMWTDVYGLPTISLRYFNVYGSRQSEEGAYALIIAKFLKQKREGKALTITGNGEQTRDFTHVKDVVDANIRAMESDKVGKGEVINIGSGKNYSINDIARMIGGDIEYIAPRIESRHTLADNRKAKELLGWTPKADFKESIEELKRLYA